MSAEAGSPTSSSTGSGSQTPLPVPPSLPYDAIDVNFATCQQSFTAVINKVFLNPIRDPNTNKITRKRKRVSLQHFIEPAFNSCVIKPINAFFFDQWADLLQLFWPLNNDGTTKTKLSNLEKIQISITFYGVRVVRMRGDDTDPNQQQNMVFILDRNTPQSDDVWIEFKSCCNRICGRNGLRFTKNKMISHLNGSDTIQIANNCNPDFLSPFNPYMPLGEVRPPTFRSKGGLLGGFVYGYIVHHDDPPKPCRGLHAYSQQIRIKDATMNPDAICEGFQVMIFGNRLDQFPKCNIGDIIRFHRIKIQYRQAGNQYPGYFQGLFDLGKKFNSFIVIDGNRTLPNTKESVKQQSSENMTFDDVSDGYLIKYLREYYHYILMQNQGNPNGSLSQMPPSGTLQNHNNNNSNNTAAKPHVDGGNHDNINRSETELVYLSEIESRHQRINVVVMIVGRYDLEESTTSNSSQNTEDGDDDDMDIDMMENETFEFNWTIWDGSYCEENRDILAESLSMQNDDEDSKDGDGSMDVDGNGDGDDGKEDSVTNNAVTITPTMTSTATMDDDEDKIPKEWEVDCIYSKEAVIGSKVKVLVAPQYETAVVCFTEIAVGSWVRFNGLLVDHEKKQLVYDDQSKIRTVEALNVRNDNFIKQRMKALYYRIHSSTGVVTVISSIVPHHQFQSYTPIRSIINSKEVDCRYLIKGKCTKYYPNDFKQFSRKNGDGNGFWMFFVLFIKDASDAEISVIFTGTEAEQFFGLGPIGDLTENNSEDLEEIEKCMEIVMDDKAIIDLCIRSYQPKGRNLIAYKAMDTVLAK